MREAVRRARGFAARARLYFTFTRPFTLLPPTFGVVSGALTAFGSAHNPDPARRFTLPVAPQISLYGDAGLGLYYGSFTSKWSFFGTNYEVSDSNFGFMMRFGVGGFYELNPQTKLSAEISLLPYFGDVDTTTWTLGVGAMFAL